MVGGPPPANVRRVGGKHNTVKQADSGFEGRCSRISRGTPEAWSRLCVMSSLLPHDLCHGRDSSRWLPALEKEMAIHSSILAWRIPWTEEPGRLHTVHGLAKSRTQLKWLSISSENAYWIPSWEVHGSLYIANGKHGTPSSKTLLCLHGQLGQLEH